MALSDFIGGSFQLTAGAAIVQDAYGRFPLIQTAPDGKAYPVVTGDYAAISATGQIVGQTSIVGAAMLGGNSSTAAYQGLSPVGVIRNSDGTFFVIAPNSSSGGVAVYKYTPLGVIVGSLTLDSSSNALHLQGLVQLSNGNMAIAWNTSAAGNTLSYAVFTPALAFVQSPTTIENAATITAGANLSIAALSGGGFALGWTNASTTRPRLAIYSNTGVVVSAPADVKATSGTYNIKIAQISNGNIVYAIYNPGASGAGMQFAIYTVAGAVSQALSTATGTTSATLYQCFLSVLPGFFAIGFVNGAGYFAVNVYANAGGQQGTTYVQQNNAVNANALGIVLANDGAQFWLFQATQTAASTRLSSIQTTGAVGSVNNANISGSYPYNETAQGFIENNYFVVIVGINTGATQNQVFVINLNNPTATISPSTVGTVTPTFGSSNPNIISGGGDFAYIAVFDIQSAASTSFYVGKYANTAILGAAVTTAAIGAFVSVQPNRIGGGTAAYAVSQINGISPKTFDHSGAAIPGNKGTMMTNGAVLKGM